MKKIGFLLLLFIMFFTSCKNMVTEFEQENVWVYVEVGLDRKNVTNFLYGQVLKKDIDNFKTNSESEKLFFIKNVRIIGDDDIIKDISLDSNEKGSYFYKVKQIKYLEILKNDPIHLKVDAVTIE